MRKLMFFLLFVALVPAIAIAEELLPDDVDQILKQLNTGTGQQSDFYRSQLRKIEQNGRAQKKSYSYADYGPSGLIAPSGPRSIPFALVEQYDLGNGAATLVTINGEVIVESGKVTYRILEIISQEFQDGHLRGTASTSGGRRR